MEVDCSPRGFGLPQISLSLTNLVETEVLVGDDTDDGLPSPISEEPLSEFDQKRDTKFENFASSCAADELPSWSEQFERSKLEQDSPDDYPSSSEAYDRPSADYCQISLGEANGEEIVTAVKYYSPVPENRATSSQNLAKITNDLENVNLQSRLPRKEKNFLRRNDPRRRTISSATGIEFQAIPVRSGTPNRLQPELKVQAASPLVRSSPRSSFNARSSRTPQPSPAIARSRLMETSPLPRPVSGYSSPGRSSASPLPSEGSRDSPLGTRSRPRTERKPFTAIVKPSPPKMDMVKEAKTRQELIKAAADKFATLPRRKNIDTGKVVQKPDQKNALPAKEPVKPTKSETLRMTRRELIPSSMTASVMTSSTYSTLPRKARTVEPPATKVEVKRTLSREPKVSAAPPRRPTLICHETETQTILYGFDLDAGAALCAKCSTPDEVKSFDTRGVQVDIGSREVEMRLREAEKRCDEAELQVRMISERLNSFEENEVTVDGYLRLREELELKSVEWQEARSLAEQARVIVEKERNERSLVQHELDRTSHRVAAMLDSMEGVEKEFANRGESLVHLESHLQLSTQTICRLQSELDASQSIIVAQQRELDRGLAAQKTLLQQLQETEAEARELQEFLQAEKATMGDSLREAESEGSSLRYQMNERERRIRELEDQTNFIGKISEQRRLDLISLQAQLVSRSGDGSSIETQAVQSAINHLYSLAGRMEQTVNDFYSRNGIQEKNLRFEYDIPDLASRPSSQSSSSSEELQRNPPEGQESSESSCPSQLSVTSSVHKVELMVEKLLKGVAFCHGELEAKKEAVILERDQLVLNLNAAHQKLREAQDELIRRSQVESKLRRELQGAHSLLSAKHSRANEDLKVIEKLSTEATALREQLNLSGNYDDLNNPRNYMPWANPTNHVTENHSYYAPECGVFLPFPEDS